MTKIIFDVDTNKMTLAEIFLLADKFINAYVDRASDLGSNLSTLDKELSNLSHEMETTSLDVVKGYHAYARFRELRRARRVVKNDLGFSKAINDEGIQMPRIRNSTKKGAKNYKAKESYRDSQVEYLNMDTLGIICWTDVVRITNSCLPDIEESKGVLEEKILRMNA